ncbi:hypothetical protein ACRQ5Q_07360 [Bradyrhizobium sp. PMVTL-01]|uniref:hypothetical protein n=1 Tax=Bradyrhizobium sp. PMVTL-01 TaxID=3434999 RepID=UPI003F731082
MRRRRTCQAERHWRHVKADGRDICVIAKNVETIDQLNWLRPEGCYEVQCFLFSAKPAAEVEQLLLRFGTKAARAAQKWRPPSIWAAHR